MRNHWFPVSTAVVLVLCASCAGSPADGSPEAVSGASPSGGGAVAAVTDSIAPVTGSGKTLVVYYSQGSATRRVAEDLALVFGADIERIVELKARGTGFFGFMSLGAQATMGKPSAIETPSFDPAGYDLVIVLTPVFSWNLSPAVRAWLRLMKGKLAKAAYVTVSGDTEPDKIVAAMSKESGTAPVVFMGFGDADFAPENRAAYLGKLAVIVDALR